MLICLVINCTLFSCKVSKTEDPKDQLFSIIENEIQLFDTNDSIFVQNQFQNHFLKSVLQDPPPMDLFQIFSPEEMKEVFKPFEIKYLLKQLENSNLSLEQHQENRKGKNLIPIYPLPPKPEKLENGTYNGLEIVRNFSRNKIIFSAPVITSTKEYALIYVVKGTESAMSSSINVYKNIEGRWEYYTKLYDAME
tara:strand:- start:146 stop:727 length:582 start_codon:yes stop_codon:yes gene_type:complete